MRAILPSFILLCILLFLAPARAQVYFSEDYTSTPPFGSPGFGWGIGEPYLVGIYEYFDIPGNDGVNKVAAVCDAGQYNYDEIITTRSIVNLTTATHPWLQMDSYFLKFTDGVHTERATIEVSTDTGHTWTVLYNVPPCPSITEYRRVGVDLTAYAGQRVLIGFRYSDDSGAVMKGWAIDNIKVQEFAAKNIAFEYALPNELLQSYLAINQSINLGGRVSNSGYDTINAFNVYYQEGSGTIQQHTVSNVSIPPLGMYDFVHSMPWTMPNVATHTIHMWVSLAGDTNLQNNQGTVTLRGAAFTPLKVPVVEQTNQTWNLYGPKGIIGFNQLALSDFAVTLIASHANDPMHYYDYDHLLGNMFPNQFNYQPTIFIDRKRKINPSHLFNTFLHDRKNFGFATLELQVSSLTSTLVTLDATITPAVEINESSRLAIVITEDKLTGDNTQWDQRNLYAGGFRGPMGGFELKPDPVPYTEMEYNYIARIAWPGPEGGLYYVPSTLSPSATYNANFAVPLHPSWNKRNLKAFLLLIRDRDSTILNSTGIRLSAVNVANVATLSEMRLFPNPADQKTVLSFLLTKNAQASLTVTDISGNIIYQTIRQEYNAGIIHQLPVNTANLSSGLYLVTLETPDSRQTLKLNVLH